MSALKELLFDLERAFWQGDAEYYRQNADTKCLVNFPGMIEVLGNEALAQSVSNDARWSDISFEQTQLYRPTDDVAVIAYVASARKGDVAPQRSAVSSGYVDRGGKWKLAWHHHTPVV